MLPAERVRRSDAAPPDVPFALVEKVRGLDMEDVRKKMAEQAAG